jgi:hypothetical protein
MQLQLSQLLLGLLSLGFVSLQRVAGESNRFDPDADLLSLHYDHAPDQDDGHSAAADRSMLETLYGLDWCKKNIVALSGAYGKNAKTFNAASDTVMDAVWSPVSGWLDAHADRDRAMAALTKRWKATLTAGGDIWVKEGGQSDITSMVVKRLGADMPTLDPRKRIHIVQHSDWNEQHTGDEALAHVKSHTDYIRIENANRYLKLDGGGDTSFQKAALSHPDFGPGWKAAFDYYNPRKRLDFSDTGELLHILGLGEVGIDEFAKRFLAMRETGWRSLFNMERSGWEVFIGVPHKTIIIPGRPPTTSENGRSGEPLGLGNDPLGVFRMVEEDGQPVLHVSGQIYGGLSTTEEFSNYHLRWQFRWGNRKWEPRLHDKRDSGVLIHCVPPHGAFWNVWMRSLECQVQEGDCGDFIPLAGAVADLRIPAGPRKGRPNFAPDGVLTSGIDYARHSASEEKPHGEWNTMEIYAVGDDAVFVVNGIPIMVIHKTREKDGGKWKPLTRGRIQIQSEAAEIDYRGMEIRTIGSFPDSLKTLVTKP